VHVAIAHEGRASPVPSLDGLPYIPSVVGFSHGRAIVGAPARAHFFVSPGDVLFGPARHLGGGVVTLGNTAYAPEDLVGRLLEHAIEAGKVAASGAIEGVALSRAAWASPEARRALAEAAHRAGTNLIRTEVSTTLAAVARLIERGPTGLVLIVDAGGWKIEATVLQLLAGEVRALGRSVDATIGSNWIDGQLVKALVHQLAHDNERNLLKEKLCYAMLREQCESARIQLSTDANTTIGLPFLTPLLGCKEPPMWRLERRFLETLARPLLEAVNQVCGEALEHAKVGLGDINEAFVLGGLAHMPAVRDAVAALLGKPVIARGDLDSLVARGAALIAEASLGRFRLRVIDDLDEHGRSDARAGWGQPIPPSLTPTPQVLPLPQPTPEPVVDKSATAPQQPRPRIDSSPRLARPARPSGELATPSAPSQHPDCPIPLPIDDAPTAPTVHSPTDDAPTTRRERATTPAPDASMPAEHAKGQAQSLAPEGTIRNPKDPAAMAAIPLDGTLPLSSPLPLSVLLLAIGRRRSCWGVGSSLDMEQLRRAFEWPEGTYTLGNEAPSARLLAMRQPMVGVVVHGIRSCLRVMDIQQILDVLRPHMHEAPRVTQRRMAVVPLLGLSARELRFVEHVLDGATSADEILRRGGIGHETAAHLLFVLNLLRALEWQGVELRPGESPAEQLRQRAHRLEKADHFEALGVHWSVSRAELDRALRSVEAELMPGGPASQVEPEAAASILARARQAHRAVSDAGERHAYLLEIHPDLDFEAIETVAEDQNQWYAWRGASADEHESARLKNELLELSRLQHHVPPKPQR
jgi:hypothetical protein